MTSENNGSYARKNLTEQLENPQKLEAKKQPADHVSKHVKILN